MILLAGLVLVALAPGVGSASPVPRWPDLPRASVTPAAPGSPLLPNLWTMAPLEFQITHEGGRRLLRVTNASVNVGLGPMELNPKKKDCNGDGDFENDRTAIQRVYEDGNGDGIFTRGVDTTVTTKVVGCFHFSRTHQHWHFKNFASYSLERLSDGVEVAAHDKIGFCLIDSQHPYPGIPGSPSENVYDTCQPDHFQGLSPGWADVYTAALPGQFVDVTSVPDGSYCFISHVDPGNKLAESSDADNTATQAIELTGDSVSPIAAAC